MKKREYKEELYRLLEQSIDDMSFEEQIRYIENLLIEFQKDNEEKRDTSSKRKKWTDEELKIILSDAATKSNCMKYAKLFHRGYGSIEEIYRWATSPQKVVKNGRQEDAFILQINRIVKELGLRG